MDSTPSFEDHIKARGGSRSSHPGFAAVQARIAKQKGVRDAGAILAASTRNASAGAKKRNPRLNRVK